MTVGRYLERRWEDVLVLTAEHLLVVAVSVAIASVVGIALGIAAHRSERASSALLTSTSAMFTIPALAYFGFLVTVTGLGYRTSLIVLTIYALLPIVRNTLTGLREVDPAILRAATGMGMSRIGLLARVQLPLAWPVIHAGIRTATVVIVGIAAIAAYVSGPGLGAEIFGGLSAIGSARAVPQALVGTVAVIAVALVLDAALQVLGKLTTSRGLQ